jgi:hypothetical protein
MTDAVQVEPVAVDKVGAAAEGRVRGGRLEDGLIGTASRDEQEYEESGIEQPSA